MCLNTCSQLLVLFWKLVEHLWGGAFLRWANGSRPWDFVVSIHPLFVLCFLTADTVWLSCHLVFCAVLVCTLSLSHGKPHKLLHARHLVAATEMPETEQMWRPRMWVWGLPGNEYKMSFWGVKCYIRRWLWLLNLVCILRIPLNDLIEWYVNLWIVSQKENGAPYLWGEITVW